ncbi:MAG: Universal stress protein [Frankiales bacterium]|nr:Universal stress protein [Frankiales bacterium]
MSAADPPVIVVGVDGSDSSRGAMRWAAHQAKLTGSQLRAVASWRWPNYITRIPPGVDLQAETERMLGEVVTSELTGYPTVPVSQVVIDGPAGPALLAHAGDASLLVVGAQGRAAYPGMLIGSVAEYCVRFGHCPVVVVRDPAKLGVS